MTCIEDLFFEIHSDLPQEGPGSDRSTLRALKTITDLPKKPHILDIGCGPGRQTLALAREIDAEIQAVDNHQPYLDRLAKKISPSSLKGTISIVNSDMENLPFPHNTFDLIWSEGAIYIMGLKKGLQYWMKFLRDKGTIAFTELSWIKAPKENEAWKFFSQAYPQMKSIDENLQILKGLDYQVLDHFTLPEEDWFKGYYTPIQNRIQDLERKYQNNPDALNLFAQEKKEIEIYQKYSSYYGYVFYIAEIQA